MPHVKKKQFLLYNTYCLHFQRLRCKMWTAHLKFSKRRYTVISLLCWHTDILFLTLFSHCSKAVIYISNFCCGLWIKLRWSPCDKRKVVKISHVKVIFQEVHNFPQNIIHDMCTYIEYYCSYFLQQMQQSRNDCNNLFWISCENSLFYTLHHAFDGTCISKFKPWKYIQTLIVNDHLTIKRLLCSK